EVHRDDSTGMDIPADPKGFFGSGVHVVHDAGWAVRADRHGREVDRAQAFADSREIRGVSGVADVVEPAGRANHHPAGPEAPPAVPERTAGKVLGRDAIDPDTPELDRLPPIQ